MDVPFLRYYPSAPLSPPSPRSQSPPDAIHPAGERLQGKLCAQDARARRKSKNTGSTCMERPGSSPPLGASGRAAPPAQFARVFAASRVGVRRNAPKKLQNLLKRADGHFVKTEIRVRQTLAEATDAAKARHRYEPIAAPLPGTLHILDFKHRFPIHTDRSALGWNRSPGLDQPESLVSP